MLGSEAESIAFTDRGIEYRAAGVVHAVDTDAAAGGAALVLAYAICGQAVRVWLGEPFDAAADGAHDACAAMARRR